MAKKQVTVFRPFSPSYNGDYPNGQTGTPGSNEWDISTYEQSIRDRGIDSAFIPTSNILQLHFARIRRYKAVYPERIDEYKQLNPEPYTITGGLPSAIAGTAEVVYVDGQVFVTKGGSRLYQVGNVQSKHIPMEFLPGESIPNGMGLQYVMVEEPDAEPEPTPVIIDPSVTLDKSSVQRGGSITITGKGFTPNSTASLRIKKTKSESPGYVVVNVNVDANQKLTYTWEVPQDAPIATHYVEIYDAGQGGKISPLKQFDVAKTTYPNAKFSITPQSITLGDTFRVSGSDYPPNQPLMLHIDGKGVLPTVTTDVSGGFDATFSAADTASLQWVIGAGTYDAYVWPSVIPSEPMGNTVKVQFFARSDGGGNGNGGNGNGGGNAGDNSGGGISVGKVAPWAIILALLGGLIYAVTR